MEKLICVVFSLKQRTQQEATWLFAWLCSYPVAHLLTATIFYLDQAETRKKTVPEAFYSPKPDLLKSLPSTIGFFHFGSTSDSSCS